VADISAPPPRRPAVLVLDDDAAMMSGGLWPVGTDVGDRDSKKDGGGERDVRNTE
jgi:hypothetical protein